MCFFVGYAEIMREVFDPIAFAFVYGYNENTITDILLVCNGFFNYHYYCIVKICGKYYSINNGKNTYQKVNLDNISGFIKAYCIYI